jgi:S-adenosylmethionine:diacylglycerol 3-amino-3-carboxypropyl transferase
MLLFGQMYEDFAIELSVFPPTGWVFAIASAGDTAMALSARGLHVTAIDINPAQIEYVRKRLMQPAWSQLGTADRLFAVCRSMYRVLGMTRMREFLQLTDPAEQIRFWREHLDTSRFRLGMRLLVNKLALQLVYHRTFLRIMPPRFDHVIRHRFERGFASHPNRTNPYAWRLLAGQEPPDHQPVVPVPGNIDLLVADAADYLEHCTPRSFDGFTLSNILDGTDAGYGERLMRAVRRAARLGAAVVLRSFAEPARHDSSKWVRIDRSLLWGLVRVERIVA